MPSSKPIPSRSLRMFWASAVALLGATIMSQGIVHPDQGAFDPVPAACCTVVGAVLLVAAIGVLCWGRFSRKVQLGFDIVASLAAMGAAALSLASAMNFINEAKLQVEADALRDAYTENQLRLEQAGAQACYQQSNTWCSAIYQVRLELLQGRKSSEQNVDLICNAPQAASVPTPAARDGLKDACRWFRTTQRHQLRDYAKLDASQSAFRFYIGSLILAALAGVQITRTVTATLQSSDTDRP